MLLDTYAWIEFFNGTEKGEIVEKILKKTRCYTCIISLAEVSEACLKAGEKANEYVERIKNFPLSCLWMK